MENNKNKPVTLGNLEALSAVLVTQDGLDEKVKKAVEDAAIEATPLEFATDEEVLALFQSTPPAQEPDEGDENGENGIEGDGE